MSREGEKISFSEGGGDKYRFQTEILTPAVILIMPEMHHDSPQSIGSGGGGKHALGKLGEGHSQGKKEGTGNCTQF